MRVDLPNVFRQLGRHQPTYAPVLEEIERHLREVIAGEHTLQEFAEHYCLLPLASTPALCGTGNPEAGDYAGLIERVQKNG